MISIDFGNSYTKVAVRADQNNPSEPVRDAALKFDRERLQFCIPTLAAQGNDLGFKFGIDVLKMADRDVLHVFRNWKPQFFEEDEQTPDKSNGQETATPSINKNWDGEYRSFVQSCIDDNNDDKILSKGEWISREKAHILTETLPKPASEIESPSTDYEELGIGYFTWLRNFVTKVCQDKGHPDVANWPVRITLPSLGGEAAARIRLRKLLEKSGWKIDQFNPMLSEPHANYWGMMTEGKNAVWTPDKPGYTKLNPNFNGMLRGSKLWERMRTNLNAQRDPIFWVLVADIGGFTVDFAMLGLNPFDPTKPTNDLYEGKSREEYKSFPLGVRDLDSRMVNALPDAHAEILQHMLLDKDANRLEGFHRDCYEAITTRRSVRLATRVRIAAPEWPIVDECVQEFSEEVQTLAENFLVAHGYERVDEVLLTGGGFNISTIRDGLFEFLKSWNSELDHPTPFAYVPALQDEVRLRTLPPHMKRLDPIIVRGATALGGASVAFDFDDE